MNAVFFVPNSADCDCVGSAWATYGLAGWWREIRVSLLDALLSYTQQLLGRHNRLVSLVANQHLSFFIPSTLA